MFVGLFLVDLLWLVCRLGWCIGCLFLLLFRLLGLLCCLCPVVLVLCRCIWCLGFHLGLLCLFVLYYNLGIVSLKYLSSCFCLFLVVVWCCLCCCSLCFVCLVGLLFRLLGFVCLLFVVVCCFVVLLCRFLVGLVCLFVFVCLGILVVVGILLLLGLAFKDEKEWSGIAKFVVAVVAIWALSRAANFYQQFYGGFDMMPLTTTWWINNSYWIIPVALIGILLWVAIGAGKGQKGAVKEALKKLGIELKYTSKLFYTLA